MNIKFLIGLALAFAVGAGCKIAGVPVPAPPALVGALLVMSMTLGYELGDRFMATRTTGRSGDDA
jgi:XapX domain-containing protein